MAGESSAGGPLYVGRAAHEGGLFPGRANINSPGYKFLNIELLILHGR